MTEAEFEKASSKTKMGSRTLAVARLVLIDGLSKAEAARRVGISKQAAGDSVKRIEREHMGIIGCPPNWVCITVCVPKFGESHEKILEIEERERRKAGLLVG